MSGKVDWPLAIGSLLFCSWLCTACTWVELTPGGEKARVLDASEITHCKKLGTTTSSVLSKVSIVERSEDKVADELARLARNAAADMGGDTVVPASDISEGKQSFTVYRCINP